MEVIQKSIKVYNVKDKHSEFQVYVFTSQNFDASLER